jgi:hypothetical protein
MPSSSTIRGLVPANSEPAMLRVWRSVVTVSRTSVW